MGKIISILSGKSKRFTFVQHVSNAVIKVMNGLFTKLTWKYLIDLHLHYKDCNGFIDIRDMVILSIKKRRLQCNMNIGFHSFTI